MSAVAQRAKAEAIQNAGADAGLCQRQDACARCLAWHDVEPFVLFFAKSVALAGVVLYFTYNQRR